jgi:hypothetical protein
VELNPATKFSKNATEEYDGSSWTAGGNLNTARTSLAGCGTQTAGLVFGGKNHNSCNRIIRWIKSWTTSQLL